MIMEHETCKNIPIIMMSSDDSINIVFKCMLRGASDFLIKPITKNELRNLWQHVWRRHLSHFPRVRYKHQDENLNQRKNGRDSENNASSNHSGDYIVPLSTKRCDTQTSCTTTRSDMDGKGEKTENMQDNIHPDCISSSVVNYIRNHEDDVCEKLAEKLPMHESEIEGYIVDANFQHEEKKQRNCQGKPSREVDLVGTLDEHLCSNHGPKSFNELQDGICNNAEIVDDAKDNKSQPLLELTLRRHESNSAVNQEKGESNMLSHSNSSAFSRYNGTAASPFLISNSFRRTEIQPSRDQGFFNSSTSWCNGTPLDTYLQGFKSPMGSLPNQYGRVPCSPFGLLPIPVPISGTTYGSFSSYGPVIPPLFYTQSGTSVCSLEPTNHEAPIQACHTDLTKKLSAPYSMGILMVKMFKSIVIKCRKRMHAIFMLHLSWVRVDVPARAVKVMLTPVDVEVSVMAAMRILQ